MKFLNTIKPVILSSDPTGSASGEFYYNYSTNKWRGYNGSSWTDVNSSSVSWSSSALYAASAGSIAVSNIPTRWFGSFYSGSTQSITDTASAYAMILGNTDYNNGVTNTSSSIVFQHSGIYNIQWSGQFRNPTVKEEDIYVWLKKNGTDYPGSTGLISLPPKHGNVDGHTVIGWNYIISINANDYIEFYWSATSGSVTLAYLPQTTNPIKPDTVSLIVTAVQV